MTNGWQIPEQFQADVADFTAVANRLRERRAVEVICEAYPPPVSWLVETFAHAITYRTVMLLEGILDNLRSGNLLCSYLSARAFLETYALFHMFNKQLGRCVASEDLEDARRLVMNRLFATRDSTLFDELPGTKSVNVLTLVDNVTGEFKDFRALYDQLSERCHPNSFGHHGLFGKLDRENQRMTYCDTKFDDGHVQVLMAVAFHGHLFERDLDKVMALLTRTKGNEAGTARTLSG